MPDTMPHNLRSGQYRFCFYFYFVRCLPPPSGSPAPPNKSLSLPRQWGTPAAVCNCLTNGQGKYIIWAKYHTLLKAKTSGPISRGGERSMLSDNKLRLFLYEEEPELVKKRTWSRSWSKVYRLCNTDHSNAKD